MKMLMILPLIAVLNSTEFSSQLTIETESNASAYHLELPQEVYKEVQHSDLHDVRIINSSDTFVPMRWDRSPVDSIKELRNFTLPVFRLTQVESQVSNGKEITKRIIGSSNNYKIQISEKVLRSLIAKEVERDHVFYIDARSLNNEELDRIHLDWQFDTQANRVFKVDLESSDDLIHWTHVIRNKSLVDVVIEDQRVLKNQIPIPGRSSNYYRITFKEFPSVHLKAVTATVSSHKKQSYKKSLKFNEFDMDSSHIVVLDTGGPFPVHSLSVQFRQKNVVSRINIYSRSDNRKNWRLILSSQLYSVSYQGETIDQLKANIATTNSRYWKLEFDNNVTASSIENIQLHWSPDTIQFMAQGEAPFYLLYGNPMVRSQAPSYWYSQLPRDIRENLFHNKATVEISPESSNPDPNRQLKPAFELPSKWIFWGVLFIVVSVLLFMAHRLLVDLNQSRDDNPQ